MSRLFHHIRGNPKALAILLVTISSASGAYYLEIGGRHSMLASALMGASVSTLVSFVITILQNPDGRKAPEAFMAAVGANVYRIGFFRRDQEFLVEFHSTAGSKNEWIDIEVRSTIVPVLDDGAVVPYYTVKAPIGLRRNQENEVYEIDGVMIKTGEAQIIKQPSYEVFRTQYVIDDHGMSEYCDNHIWACPVESYTVKINGNGAMDGTAEEFIGHNHIRLEQITKSTNTNVVFRSRNAAFPQQGFRWKLVRKSAGE